MAIELEDLMVDARSLHLGGFKERHGEAFLVRSTSDGEMALDPADDIATSPGRRPPTDLVLPMLRGREGEGARSQHWVYPIRRKTGDGEITVGRVGTTDICLPDKSISRLHAVFERVADGRYRLFDKNSRNGTFVARRQLEPGSGVVVPPRQTVQFGNVVMSFYHAKELVELIYQLR
jgi:hypothetical protein